MQTFYNKRKFSSFYFGEFKKENALNKISIKTLTISLIIDLFLVIHLIIIHD